MNYEKKYKEALERAKLSRLQLLDIGEEVTEIEYIFPELVESEDERIRNGLITFFQRFPRTNLYDVSLNAKDILAWLEKQGKKKITWTDNDRIMTFTLLRDVDQMTYISKEGKNERLEWLNSLDDRFKKE